MFALKSLRNYQSLRRYFSTYNIYSQRTFKNEEANETSIPIYKSSISEKTLSEFSLQYKPFPEFFSLATFFIEKFAYNHPKHFVTSLEFFKESNLLKFTCLAHSGVYQKIVYPENIIPVTYADYATSAPQNLFRLPEIIDPEMMYFNTFQNEFYVFDSKGQWQDIDGVEELSLGKLWNERKFQDRYFQ